MLSKIPFCLETKVAVLASKRPDIGVSSYVLFQHRRFFAAYSTTITDIFAPAPAPNVGIIVICRLVSSLHSSHWSGTVRFLKKKQNKHHMVKFEMKVYTTSEGPCALLPSML